MRWLLNRWERTCTGQGQLVPVVGEPGIGKSRLGDEFRSCVRDNPHLWVECAGDQFSQSAPFHAVTQILNQGLGWRGDESPKERVAHLERNLELAGLRLGEAVPLIAEMLGLPIPDKYPPLAFTSDRRRRRLLATLTAWVLNAARVQPIVLVLGGEGGSVAREIPATLRDSLTERLDRLGPAKEVAQIAAVIGREFSFELLQAVGAIDEGELQVALQELVGAELIYARGVAPEATYQFKHALIQDAAYEALLKTERRELHLRVAQTITQKLPAVAEEQPELIARHWAEAGARELALAAWKKAAEAAFERRAFKGAEEAYRQALATIRSLPESSERDAQELELVIRSFKCCRQRNDGPPRKPPTLPRTHKRWRKRPTILLSSSFRWLGCSPRSLPALTTTRRRARLPIGSLTWPTAKAVQHVWVQHMLVTLPSLTSEQTSPARKNTLRHRCDARAGRQDLFFCPGGRVRLRRPYGVVARFS